MALVSGAPRKNKGASEALEVHRRTASKIQSQHDAKTECYVFFSIRTKNAS